MHIISEQQVHSSLSFKAVIEALKIGFAKPAGTPPRQVFPLTEDANNHDAFAVLPAWNNEVIGVKSFTYFPSNTEKGFKSLYSKIMLFDRQHGEPLALIDGTSVTFWRTASVSALASSYLSRPDSRHLVFFGSGNLALYMIEAHLSVRPIEKVTLVARDKAKVASLISTLSIKFKGIEFTSGNANEATINSADIVSCATGSHEPLFDGAWLKPGAHVDLIGNHHKQHRECDSITVTRSKLFVDSRVNVLNEAGEVLIPISEGLIDSSFVVAELSELHDVSFVRSGDDITVFKSVGMALSDLLTAHLVYRLVL
ncbi:ornithine cyclodeaminase family protein [Pseudoalteromonas sp. MMG012]|uniref:ornithine cyclodeaminase family protein n=1 Tax=Pseudoalteromonas sp. MMG012 TaxID=2822686 RepID=UPI001B3A2639|nr:ornithine cyclodeaminase family protein [Pseudoalteromonas sp. MMG012]MBQ4851597.1 ornithine cyclodeaminase family protein [Pseudoalteromonas sp. MMG012]